MRSAIAEHGYRISFGRTQLVGISSLLVIEIAVLGLGLFAQITAPLRGWLVAFAILSSVSIGSMTLLLIHRLTGGEWGLAAAPVLRPAAAMMPVVLLGFIPVLCTLGHIYPWAADPSVVPADVARWYYNAPAFWLRALIALGGWSILGVLFALGSRSRLLAGLGLTFFGLTINLVAVDWYLSLAPHYTATAFAATIAIQQLLAAFAMVAAIGAPGIDGKVAGDLGGLLIATILGVVYLEFMTFVVAWYGNLPDKAEWFLRRSGPGWVSVLLAAIAVGALVPFAMLMVKSVRRSRRGLRIAGALVLIGSALHFAWLLIPQFDNQAGVVAAAVAALVVLVLTLILVTGLGPIVEPSNAE